jgi:hypothetical protein
MLCSKPNHKRLQPDRSSASSSPSPSTAVLLLPQQCPQCSAPPMLSPLPSHCQLLLLLLVHATSYCCSQIPHKHASHLCHVPRSHLRPLPAAAADYACHQLLLLKTLRNHAAHLCYIPYPICCALSAAAACRTAHQLLIHANLPKQKHALPVPHHVVPSAAPCQQQLPAGQPTSCCQAAAAAAPHPTASCTSPAGSHTALQHRLLPRMLPAMQLAGAAAAALLPTRMWPAPAVCVVGAAACSQPSSWTTTDDLAGSLLWPTPAEQQDNTKQDHN